MMLKSPIAFQWHRVLTDLCAFPSENLPQRDTLIVTTLQGWTPEKLLGYKHGVVFDPRALLELVEILSSQ